MTTLTAAGCRHARLSIETAHPTQFIDITDEVEALVEQSGLCAGLINVQSLHTTTAVIVNEHEPLLLTDLAALLERLAPADAVYRHDNVGLRTANCVLGERPNGHSHARAMLLPTAVSLNVSGGRLQLGRWQRLFLVELDGPQRRGVSVLLMGECDA
jgi:secondary thiamine-phosphate synthase enzyme